LKIEEFCLILGGYQLKVQNQAGFQPSSSEKD
jgi:hypothetical protein